MLIEKRFHCCYCDEMISFVLDLSVESQMAVEDCEVCCQPIEFCYEVLDGVISSFEVCRQE